MKPIIKWSGGKAKELKFFQEFFPSEYNTYIEPFSGGAAVYFNLEHLPSIINDINFELIQFYKILSNKKDRTKLLETLELLQERRSILKDYVSNLTELEILEIIDTKRIYNSPFGIASSDFIDSPIKPLLSELNISLKDKIKRIKNIEEKENIKFNVEELREHIETAFQSTLYFYCRKIYNKEINKDTDRPWYVAHWLFVREFCYSSMFRFSKSGNFNVPYGGISYNKKDLSNKIERLVDSKLINLLENTDINNLDFEDLFKKYKYFDKDDFMFLDPPYDTEFSQYNKEKDFDKNEQIRLRDLLLKVNCKIMIVIKETDFILSLYEKDFNIQKFDKKYATNMRNRNNQEVVHLIITNY